MSTAEENNRPPPASSRLRGRAPRRATCRSVRLLVLPELFVRDYWRRPGAGTNRLARRWKLRQGRGREEVAEARLPAELGRVEGQCQPLQLRDSSRSPARAGRCRHALGPGTVEECVPCWGAQVHRALQQVLSVPVVHEAVSRLRYGGHRGRWRGEGDRGNERLTPEEEVLGGRRVGLEGYGREWVNGESSLAAQKELRVPPSHRY